MVNSSKAQACFSNASGLFFSAMNNNAREEEMPEEGRRWYWWWDNSLGYVQRWHTMRRSLELTARAMGLREQAAPADDSVNQATSRPQAQRRT